jgi:hypothetical protein
MNTLNKVEVASQLFVEAHDRYTSAAATDIDYIVSIVLCGAVVGVVSPLLKEQGGHTAHSLLARIGNLIAAPGEPPTHEGVFRATYNAFKHAGNDRRNIAPSTDLEITTDLKREAAHMLYAAKDDFQQIKVDFVVRERLSPRFISLLESGDSYA